ncbi:MAG: PilZ domain-containing protein [Candidatus Omnitrophica bacterium]|nr:PilZ domain-containing protein [Candidatus Omnitrophota bacterium]
MQERRTTVRVPHRGRTHYCPADEAPKDGQLINLSERGAGVLTREPRQAGERIAIHVSLPSISQPLTAGGVVRWSDPEPRELGWYPAGIEWLPLEETAQQGLHQFLRAAEHAPAAWLWVLAAKRFAFLAGLVGLAMLMALLMAWGALAHRRNLRLRAVFSEQAKAMDQLEIAKASLEQALTAATTSLADTVQTVEQLGTQAQTLEQTVEQLRSHVSEVRQSYDQVRGERDQFIQRVVNLERERVDRIPVRELQLAIREAIERRQLNLFSSVPVLSVLKRRTEAPRPPPTPRQPPKPAPPLVGNQGYVMLNGKPTMPATPQRVRVYDPQLAPSD